MDVSLKVLIADDHPLVRAGIRRTLEASRHISVVGEAGSGDELLVLIERRRPQMVLLDLRMPGLGGLQCIAQIAQSWPEIRTVVVSACEERASIDAALAAGASGYVVKSASPTELPKVLQQAWSRDGGQGALAPVVYGAAPAQAKRGALTRREAAVLRAVAGGLTTRAISEQLWLSEHTVKFHLTNIYRKLGVSNRSGAVRYALENELAPLGSTVAAAA
jgi:DNA-binding NarL/FixJ family response regulator